MPIYEYRCHKCGTVFETKQKFSDEPLKTHEECGGEVERLLSAPAIQFKGSGWYITDYAKSGSSQPKSSGGVEKPAAAATSGDSSSSSSPAPSSSSTPASTTSSTTNTTPKSA